MVRHCYRRSGSTRENIILAVVLSVKHFAPHQSPHLSVIINLLQHIATGVIVVIQGYDVECRSTHVLLGTVVVVPSAHDSVLLELFLFVHFIVAAVVSAKPLFSQVVDFCLSSFESFLSHGLIGNVEIFVEPLGLRNELS